MADHAPATWVTRQQGEMNWQSSGFGGCTYWHCIMNERILRVVSRAGAEARVYLVQTHTILGLKWAELSMDSQLDCILPL